MKKKGILSARAEVLGSLEREIMETLWAGGAMSGKEVFEELREKRPLALTTVLTVLDRLVKKGLVNKSRGESVNLFRARYSKDEFAREVSGAILRDVMKISASSATASFVDLLADEDPEELKRLASLIEKKRREMKG